MNNFTNKFTGTTKEDVEWREYDIHETEVADSSAFLFQTKKDNDDNDNDDDDEWQTFEYRKNIQHSSDTMIFQLTHQDDYTQSTGTAIWRGSEVLADYLLQHPTLVKDQSVLELGAGVGLVGLVAYYLGASRVLWTDGDEQVLMNLRRNVKRNTTTRRRSVESLQHQASGMVHSSCPQLIWGKHLDLFHQEYGRNQLMLGTDLFYMTKSLDPLFQTIDTLLTEEGQFVAVNTCASQSPMEVVFQVASKYGFDYSTSLLMVTETEEEQEEEWNCVKKKDYIYTFTRKSKSTIHVVD